MTPLLARIGVATALAALFAGVAVGQSCPTTMPPIGNGLRSAFDMQGPYFLNKQQATNHFEAYWRYQWTITIAPYKGVICDLSVDSATDDAMQVGYKIKWAPETRDPNTNQPVAPDCSVNYQYEQMQAPLTTTAYCPTGYELLTGTYNGVPGTLYCKMKLPGIANCPDKKIMEFNRGKCPAGPKGSSVVGNPCDAATGNKFQEETDYSGPTGLRFTRYYNSDASTVTASMGKLWRSEFDRRLEFPNLASNGGKFNTGNPRVYAHRPDGKILWFTFDLTSATSVAAGTRERLYRIDSQTWELVTPDGARERYVLRSNAAQTASFGRLEKITFRGGRTLTLAYTTADRLGSIRDDFGHTLSFTFASGRVSAITDPAGNKVLYQYNVQGHLSAVIYPDTTPANANDNPRRLYNYADSTNVGALTSIIDESGATFATWMYDSSRRVTLNQHASGAEQVTLTYNADGTTSVGFASGKTSTIAFQILNSVPRTTGVTTGSDLVANSYDANGFLTSSTDARGNSTLYAHDALGFETSRTEAVGSAAERVVTTTWNSSFDAPNSVTAAGLTKLFTYDANGNISTRTFVDSLAIPSTSRVWTYTHDAYGRVLTENGPRTDVADMTTYTYYSCTTGFQCGQVNTITNSANHVVTYNTYDAHGRPTQITDANGLVTRFAYDVLQRITDRCVGGTLPSCVGGELTRFEYWPTGLLKQITSPDGSTIQYAYDNAQRLTQIQDGHGNKITYTLDGMGNRTTEAIYDSSNTLKRTHSRVYNSLNQLWKDVNAAGTSAVTTVFGYDSHGNQTTVNAPLSRSMTNAYDELNRLNQILDANSGVTQYTYDSNDNLTSVTDPRSFVTSYTYTGFGDLKTQSSPDTGVVTNTYDSNGNLSTSTDARGAVTAHTYDNMNRTISTAYTLGGVTDQTTTFTYDGGTNQRGHLTAASDANHSLSWSYDTRGRVTGKGQTVGSITKSIGYGYNASGQLSSIVLPSGSTILYGFNSNNQVTSVTLQGATNITILQNVTYDPFGPVTGWDWGNGTDSVSRMFDADGKITTITSAGQRSFGYDDAFRVSSVNDIGDPSKSWTFNYDILDRLNSAVGIGTTFGYAYDPNGNRISQTGTSASAYTVSNSSNSLVSISGAISRSYIYDAAGNILADGATVHSYNNANRMVAARLVGNSDTIYVYNALGQRVKKSGGAIWSATYFVYDEAGHLIGQYDSSGGLVQETIWLGDIPVATLRPSGGGLALFYVHTDQLNTPRKISRPSDNQLVWTWDPTPFGEGAPNENPASLGVFTYDLRFPGQQFDAETNLHYNYFRDYDPSIGRYVESDPVGLTGGFNTYGYVGNNPVTFTDSRGLLTDGECCARSQQLAQNEKGSAIGWVICCEGRKVACVFKRKDGNGGKARGILDKCILEHEQTHLSEIDCPSCTREPTRPLRSGNNSWPEYHRSECRGGRTEIACLKRRLAECGSDQACRGTVQEEISKLQSQYQRCGGGP
jgi:RHS repeat-associated protein